VKKELIFIALVAGVTSAAVAAPKPYKYLRTIDFGTTTSGAYRATVAVSDSRGFIYTGSNFTDSINYFDPLTVESHNDPNFKVVYDASTPADPFGPHSYEGITIDSNGDVYASGVNGPSGSPAPPPDTTVLIRCTPDNPANPATWTNDLITMPAGVFGGCTAVGDNKLVMPVMATSGLQFFNVSGTAASLDGSEVAGPNDPFGISAVADLPNNRLLETTANDLQTGEVYKFSSNGTPAGTSYSATGNPIQTSEESSHLVFERVAPLRYRTASVNSTDQIMVVSRNRGTAGTGGNQFELYDLASSSQTPYQVIDGTGTPEGKYVTETGTARCYGCAFFNQNGKSYVFLYVGNQDLIFHAQIFEQDTTSEVTDWTLY
jgi:hypothetical protein